METKISIWGDTIPGNSNKSKLPDLSVKHGGTPIVDLFLFGLTLGGTEYRNIEKKADRLTFSTEITPGHEKTTYEDIPYLLPFIAPGAEKVVIVVPGGGYAYKSCDMDPNDGEGRAIARRLNREGISAFVLWYRSNPYRYPIPLLDAQRAVRWVRAHAEQYGYDKEQIGMIGFSAGGMQVCQTLNTMRNRPVVWQGYEEDGTDKVSAHLNHAAMIYPITNYRYAQPGLCCVLPHEKAKEPAQREKFIAEYENVRFVQENDPPQFLCYGTKDGDPVKKSTREYVDKLEELGIPHCFFEIDGAGHGFGACESKAFGKYAYWLDRYVEWLKTL